MKKEILLSIILILLVNSCCTRPRPTEINSPDNTIKLAFYLNDSNQMAYHITVNDTPFIAPSILGFEARDGINLQKISTLPEQISTPKMKYGHNRGEKINQYAIIIMKWLYI